MARARDGTRRDRLAHAYLRRVASSSGWKGGPLEGLHTGVLKDLLAETPRTDLEGLFALSQIAEDLDLAKHRRILMDIVSQVPKDHRVRLTLAVSYMTGYGGVFIFKNGKIVGRKPSDAPLDLQATLKHSRIIIDQQPDFAPAYYYAYRASQGQDRVRYLQGYVAHEKDKTCRAYLSASKELEKLESKK